MKVLVAEDDPVSRRVLEEMLKSWGHEVVAARDGQEAWAVLGGPHPPRMAILDWMMPGMDGPEVLRRARAAEATRGCYLFLLTSKDRREDIVAGLGAGADDYIVKPFDSKVMKARVDVGVRVVELQEGLAARVQELEEALARVRELQALLPICSYCKKVRDDEGYWKQVETYISEHTQVRFSHSFCPDCYRTHVVPELEKLKSNAA